MNTINRFALAALFSILVLTTSINGNRTFQTPFHSGKLFERPQRVTILERMRTSSAFSSALNSAGMPGGIATITDCSQEATYLFPSTASSLQGKLNGIVSTDPRIVWWITRGVVNIAPKSGDPELLNLRVREVKVRAARSLGEAVGQLLANPTVQKRITELHLSSGPTRTGISDLSRPGNVRGKDGRRYSLNLRNVTVREALNAIVRAHGKAVWEYQERRCNGNAEFQIQFLAS